MLAGMTDEQFEELCVISGVQYQVADEISVAIKQAEGEKCPRCWNYRELGGNEHHPHVCKRCGDALDEIGFEEPAE